jgi:hypothetical protein
MAGRKIAGTRDVNYTITETLMNTQPVWQCNCFIHLSGIVLRSIKDCEMRLLLLYGAHHLVTSQCFRNITTFWGKVKSPSPVVFLAISKIT